MCPRPHSQIVAELGQGVDSSPSELGPLWGTGLQGLSLDAGVWRGQSPERCGCGWEIWTQRTCLRVRIPSLSQKLANTSEPQFLY